MHIVPKDKLAKLGPLCSFPVMGTELYGQYPVQKRVNMSEELSKRIEDYRFDNRIRSENAAMRELLELGLEAAAQAAKKRRSE